MAGEKTAKFYESLTAVAVREAIKGGRYAKLNVYREVKLPGVSIRNDVVVGVSEVEPSLIFLVTHSNLEVDWNKKFKRDSAEIIELAISDLKIKGVFLVLFDRSVLPGHLKTAAFSLSGLVIAKDFDPKNQIQTMAHEGALLQKLDELDEHDRQQELRRIFGATRERRELLESFVSELREKLRSATSTSLDAGGYIALTKVHVAKRTGKLRRVTTRHTRFNRGISKLGFFNAADREKIINSKLLLGDFQWATANIYWPIDNKTKGQMLTQEGRSGFRCKDPEILGGPLGSRTAPVIVERIADSLKITEIDKIIERGRQEMAHLYEARIQSKSVFDASIEFIQLHRDKLTNGRYLGGLLQEVAAEPTRAFSKYCDGGVITYQLRWNWLYTALVALFKATAKTKTGYGTKQGYGYSKISAGMTTQGHRSAVEHSILQHHEYCLRQLNADLIAEVGVSMAGWLKKIPARLVNDPPADPYRYLLLSEVEDKFLPNAIDVLPAMVELAAVRYGIEIQKTHMTSCLAVASEAGGTAGRTNVYRSKDTIIWYKASHLRQNVLHKRKELQSTVASWWQTWDPIKEIFIPTKAFKKTILVIDGDWEEEDLKLMHAFGWDEFLYPDELDRLPDLIV